MRTKIILLGHSNGGPTMSFYQAVAENGISYCQGSNKLVECDNDRTELPPADGIIFMDAHPGNGINAVRSINPAVTNDAAVLDKIRTAQINPALDPFNSENSYNPNGPSMYSEEFGSMMFLTVRSFLSTRAIRSNDSMDKIDWCSSNNSTPCALPRVSMPILVAAMGTHYFVRDSEIFYEMAASKDKDFIVIEGATHGGTPCKECEQYPGQYSNTVKNLFDYMRDWIHERY